AGGRARLPRLLPLAGLLLDDERHVSAARGLPGNAGARGHFRASLTVAVASSGFAATVGLAAVAAASRFPHGLAAHAHASSVWLQWPRPLPQHGRLVAVEDAARWPVALIQPAELEPRITGRARDGHPFGRRAGIDDRGSDGEVLALDAGIVGPGRA